MDETGDRVHTISERMEGPCRGVADFEGAPHFYEAEVAGESDLDDYDGGPFLLTPIDVDLFSLVLEGWAIWARWEHAYFTGRSTLAEHPALPADRARHDELAAIFEKKLVTDRARAVRATGKFSGRPSLGMSATVSWARL